MPGAPKGTGTAKVGPSAPKPPSAPKTAATYKVAENDSLYPLVAAGVGGVGGHALGDKVLAPLLKMKERVLRAKLQNAQEALAALGKTQKSAPGAMAATGALLLAALTALAVKKKQNEKVDYNRFQSYDQSGGGFHPSQAQQFGSY